MTVCNRSLWSRCSVRLFLEVLTILTILLIDRCHCIHSSGRSSHRQCLPSRRNTKSQNDAVATRPLEGDSRFIQRNKRALHAALISSNPGNVRSGKDDGEEPLPDEEVDFNLDVVKSQIYGELKQSEDILKNILARVLDHLLQYLKHKVANMFLQFYIVNPLGMGIGNLLNTELNDIYLTRYSRNENQIDHVNLYSKLGIPVDATPKSFNMDYIEVEVPSAFGVRISKRCWLIKSKNDKATGAFVLLHGWFGNLQSCLPFASILNKNGILNSHHVLIVDLRDHVGKSFESNIGLKGVTDIYDAVSYLQRELGVDYVSLYAQSVSGLSALWFADVWHSAKTECGDGKNSKASNRTFPEINGMDIDVLTNVHLDKIIIESPVPNVQQFILNTPSESLSWVAEQFISAIDSKLGGHVKRLSLRELLNNPGISKVHILQGLKDDVTTPEMLHRELSGEDGPKNVKLHIFKNAGHINMCSACPQEYNKILKSIVDDGGLFGWLLSLLATTHNAVDELIV